MIYVVTDDDKNYKIGIADNVKTRIGHLQTSSSRKFKLLMTIELLVSNPFDDKTVEKALHHYYRFGNVRGEWFNKNCYMDLIQKSPDDILRIVPPYDYSNGNSIIVTRYLRSSSKKPIRLSPRSQKVAL